MGTKKENPGAVAEVMVVWIYCGKVGIRNINLTTYTICTPLHPTNRAGRRCLSRNRSIRRMPCGFECTGDISMLYRPPPPEA